MKDSGYIYVYNNEEMEGGQFWEQDEGRSRRGKGDRGTTVDSPGRWESPKGTMRNAYKHHKEVPNDRFTSLSGQVGVSVLSEMVVRVTGPTLQPIPPLISLIILSRNPSNRTIQ